VLNRSTNRCRGQKTEEQVHMFNKKQSYILILLSVCDGARVHHKRPIGLGPTLSDFHRPGPPWGAGSGPSQKAGQLSGPLHG